MPGKITRAARKALAKSNYPDFYAILFTPFKFPLLFTAKNRSS